MINPVEAVLFDLLRKVHVGKIVFCHEQETAGVLINAVDNTRS